MVIVTSLHKHGTVQWLNQMASFQLKSNGMSHQVVMRSSKRKQLAVLVKLNGDRNMNATSYLLMLCLSVQSSWLKSQSSCNLSNHDKFFTMLYFGTKLSQVEHT